MSSGRRITTLLLHVFTAAIVATAASTAPSSRLDSASRPVEAELIAPLSSLFDSARTDPAFAVRGTFSYTDPENGRRVTLDDVQVEVRGNTSRRRGECDFPKLKVTLKDGQSGGPTLPGTSRAVRIGTHCGDAPDGELTGNGRWPNEKAPFREAFVYHLLDVMGVPTLRARPARIRYVDTAAADAQPLVRNAIFLEDLDDAARRFGAGDEIPMARFTSARELIAADDAARLAFGEAMIGNFDWCLRFSADDRYRCDASKPLWNIGAFERPGGRALPLMFDFDLAGIVTGRHPWFDHVFSDVYLGPGSRPQTEAIAQVQRTRTLFTRAELDATRAHFMARKRAAYDALSTAALDDAGRTFAREYLDAFFRAIERDDDFYAPVIGVRGARPYLDPGRSKTACGENDAMPPGTPVGSVQARSGGMIQAPILDALWHWTNECPAVRRGPVWIDADAVTRDFPAISPR